jgi:hypothetical protein
LVTVALSALPHWHTVPVVVDVGVLVVAVCYDGKDMWHEIAMYLREACLVG